MTFSIAFPCAVAIFPVVRNASVAKDEPDQILEAGLSTDIVRQDKYTSLAGLEAHHCVRGLAVVPTLEEAMTLWAVKDYYSQTGVQILALIIKWQLGNKGRELVGRSDM